MRVKNESYHEEIKLRVLSYVPEHQNKGKQHYQFESRKRDVSAHVGQVSHPIECHSSSLVSHDWCSLDKGPEPNEVGEVFTGGYPRRNRRPSWLKMRESALLHVWSKNTGFYLHRRLLVGLFHETS